MASANKLHHSIEEVVVSAEYMLSQQNNVSIILRFVLSMVELNRNTETNDICAPPERLELSTC